MYRSDLEDLRKVCDSTECPEKYARTYRLLAENMEYSLEERSYFIETAAEISTGLAENYDILPIYARIGRMEVEKGSLLNALQSFMKGMNFVGLKDDEEAIEQESWFLTGYGIFLFDVRAFQEAKAIFKDCALIMRKRSDDYGEAVAWNNVALTYQALGDLDSALILYNRALEIRKKIGREILVSHSYIYLARVYRQQNKMALSDSILQLANRFSVDEDRYNVLGDIYMEWAQNSYQLGELDSMAVYLEKAKVINEYYKNRRWLSLKIKCYEAKGLNDSLLYYLDKGIWYAQEVDNNDLGFEYLLAKGKLLQDLNRQEMAEECLLQAAILAEEVLEAKQNLQIQSLQVQSTFNQDRNRIKNLESETQYQKEIIKDQNLTIVYVSTIALVLLVSIIVFYRLNNNLRRASRLITLMSKRTIAGANAVSNAVLAIDEKGNLAFGNLAAERYFKNFYNTELKPLKPFIKQFKLTEEQEFWNLLIEQTLRQKNLQKVNHRIADGQNFYHIFSISKIELEGQDAGFVIVITDISESLRQNQALNQKTKALERANEAKEKMLSLLAHDLKEGVIGSLELAKISQAGEEDVEMYKKHLSLIIDSLSKTRTLLFKTLDWVRDQSDGIKLGQRSFYIDRLAKDVISEIIDQAEKKQVSLINLIPENTAIKADPNALRVVLRNLITNGVKYVYANSGKVAIKSEKLDDHRIKIIIEDNGIGMSADQVNLLLSLSNRESKEGTSGEKGTAIGLGLSQDLLFGMNSSLQINSALDQGSEFYFILELDS